MADENVIKVILVGEAGTGKTSIINALTGIKFNSNEITSTAAEFSDKTITVKGKDYNITLWDTAGQERFRSVTKIFIKEAKIVIFVYSITDKKSFEQVDFWHQTVKNILGDDPILGLAGNKKDLFLKQEEVTEEEGEKKAQELGAIFKLTSAKTKVGINEFIEQLVEEYAKKNGDIFDGSKGSKLKSGSDKEKKKSKCC